LHPVIAACFVISGLTSLIFEILWVRMLTTSVFGASHLAVATVLSVFMGGLALGSFLASRFADRLERPVLVYGLLEGGIGLYGLLLPVLLGSMPEVHRALWAALEGSFYTYSLVRFLLAAAVLILPATLMGATLPVLSRFVVSQASEAGRRVGWLYTLNTLGAVLGVGVGGFLLLPEFGLSSTNRIAVFIALALCTVLVLLHRRGYFERSRLGQDELEELMHPERVEAHREEVGGLPRWAVRLVVLAFALGGFSAMVFQVVWTRALVLAYGSSVYSFNLILLTFLAGIGLGSLYFTTRRVDNLRGGISVLGQIYLAIGVTAFASSLFIDELPFAVLAMVRDARVQVGDLLFSEFLLAGAVVLLPTFGMGAVFPLVIRLTARQTGAVGGSVGRVYAANTLGAILGSFCAGFVLLPFVGAQGAMVAALLIDLVLAAALIVVGQRVHRTPRRPAVLWAGGALAAAIAILLAPGWDPARLSAGLFRVYVSHEVYSAQRWKPPDEVLFFKHGTSCTVTVELRGDDSLALKVNGKTDASSRSDMPTQILVAGLPLLLMPDARDVAVIGYGSGVTVGAALQFPVESVLAIELEEAVVEGAEFFKDVSHDPRSDPRLTLMHDDGRNVLSATERKFDVIISEPSNPWITGVSNLFTTDYFTLAKQRLEPDGVFGQWLQMYELSEDNVRIIARTFASCFKYVLLFVSEPESTDAILIGADHPVRLNREALRKAFADKRISAEMKRAKVHGPEDVLSLLLLGDRDVPTTIGPGPVNTDDNMLIEFAAPRDMLQYARHREFALEIYYKDSADVDLLAYIDDLPEDPVELAAVLADQAYSLLRHGRIIAAGRVSTRALELAPDPRAERARLMSMLFLQEDRYPPKIDWPGEEDPEYAAFALVRTYTERNRFDDAVREIEERHEMFLKRKEFRFLLGFLLYADNQFERAIGVLGELLEDEPDYALLEPTLVYYLARAHGWRAENDDAVEQMERYFELEGLGKPVASSQ